MDLAVSGRGFGLSHLRYPNLSSIIRGMDMIPIQSSNLVGASFSEDTETISVQFRNGAIYAYPCTGEEWDDFIAAPSQGKFFAATFRGREFEIVLRGTMDRRMS